MELLKLALALLIAAQGANVPQDVRENAVQVALYAMSASQVVTIEEKRTVAESAAGGLAVASSSPAKAPPGEVLEQVFDPERGYFGKDGCWYTLPVGQRFNGFKTWCPPAI
jgi:hypothetical protein